MAYEFFESVLVVFGISASIIYLLGKVKLPSIVGFLLAGTIIGPYGLALIKDIKDVEMTAEIGIILLMFTIGIEFSLSKLSALKKEVFLFGSLQILSTTAICTFFGYFILDTKLTSSIFYGFVISLSSTAIVMKLLAEKGELNTRHGRICVGILLFQDLCVIPFMLLTRLFSEAEIQLAGGYIFTLFKSILILFFVFTFSRTAVPYLLHEIGKTRMRELFILVTVLICMSTAYFTSKLGLSLALGAFLAGVLISESEYSSQVLSDMLPFKEIFSGIFFISVGMLLDLDFLKLRFFEGLLLVGTVIFIKASAIFFTIYPYLRSLKITLRAGFFLAQIGEFSFILAFAGKMAGLIDDFEYQTFITITVVSMLLTPVTMKYTPGFVDFLTKRRPFYFLEKTSRLKDGEIPVRKTNHVIIIGFGLNGRNLARVLKESQIPYVILELNPETVRKSRKRGEPIYYGDGTSPEILRKLGIRFAKVLVVAISDPIATKRIVEIARMENRKLHIIVRTRYVSEMEELLALGADEVIPEEFETSLEIFGRVLHHFGVPRNKILEKIETIRSDGYKTLRADTLAKTRVGLECFVVEGLEMDSYFVEKDSWICGKSIRDIDLRAKTGATIIAVRRNETNILNPDPDLPIREGDILIYIGTKDQLLSAFHYLSK
ncbi:MAG: cation:proton antiporter [Desulfobacterota bacterium]|nr:cation:proton antiporter [Thermodesulfobacteriota bacterium]MDW8001646.1 cation:proton antiporter [Deltaproteobacteria bacterium]